MKKVLGKADLDMDEVFFWLDNLKEKDLRLWTAKYLQWVARKMGEHLEAQL